MDVRPRMATGVLLHMFAGEREYLTMYIYQGQVWRSYDRFFWPFLSLFLHDFSTFKMAVYTSLYRVTYIQFWSVYEKLHTEIYRCQSVTLKLFDWFVGVL